jgi:hypothetical protein
MISSPVSLDEKVSPKLGALESEDEKHGGWIEGAQKGMMVAGEEDVRASTWSQTYGSPNRSD